MDIMLSSKVALITGANKGIGLAIVKELCKRGVGAVYLASRDEERGRKAVETLNAEGLQPIFIQLEVTDRASVQAAAELMSKKHGGLDILINNAGVSAKNYIKTTFEDSERIINVNYRSNLIIQEYLFPILKENARVINVSSDCGHISNLRNKYWIERLTKDDITLADVNAFVEWFLESAKNDNYKEEDFAETTMLPYRISKVALCALTRVQQKEVGRSISVNSLHPGFVKTDMSRHNGFLTTAEAADAPAYLALDAPQELQGAYIWYDKTEKDWTNSNLDLYCKFYKLGRPAEGNVSM